MIDSKPDSFVFGKIYYDETNAGSVTIDKQTGQKVSTNSYDTRCEYNCGVGATINATKSGIINADIAFLNEYAISGSAFATTKYVHVSLNYNFSHENPTFTLKLLTRNDEKTAPYIGYITYQYDYLAVKDGALLEWREFSIESSSELLFDDEHTSFEDYIADDFAYRVDAPKWYLDGTYFKIKNMTQEKQLIAGNNLFGTGLFEPYTALAFMDSLNDEANLQQMDTESVYKSVSRFCGEDDLEYVFLAQRNTNASYINHANNPNIEDPGIIPNPDDKVAKSIVFYDDSSKKLIDSRITISNRLLKSLFTGFADSSTGTYVLVDAFYANKSNVPFEAISSNSLLTSVYFSYKISLEIPNGGGTYGPIDVSIEDRVKDIFREFDERYGITSSDVNGNFNLYVRSDTKYVTGTLQLKYDGDLSFLDERPSFPQVLADYGVPSWDGQDTTAFQYTSDVTGGYLCDIYSSHVESEVSDYISKLYDKGYFEISENVTSSRVSILFGNYYDENYKIRIKLSYSRDNPTKVTLKTYKIDILNTGMISYNFPSDFTSMGVPEYNFSNLTPYPEYRYDSTATPGLLYINGSNSSQRETYYDYLSIHGFSFQTVSDYYSVFSHKDNSEPYITYIYFIFYDSLETDFIMQAYQYTNPDYDGSIKINSLFIMFNFGPFDLGTIYSNQEFYSYGPNEWYWTGGYIPIGKQFKIIANEDWNINNPDSTYKGFGYDDFTNIDEYTYLFSRGEDGAIVVEQTCVINNIHVIKNKNKLEFTIDAQYVSVF